MVNLAIDDLRTSVAVKAMECAKPNQVKTSLGLLDPIVAQVFEDNLHKVISDGLDLLFYNSDEGRSFTKAHSTEVAAEQLTKYAKMFFLTCDVGGWLSYDGAGPKYDCKCSHTNGAGNRYPDAFLYAINSGRSYASATKFANVAPARLVSHSGPRLTMVEYGKLKQRFNI